MKSITTSSNLVRIALDGAVTTVGSGSGAIEELAFGPDGVQHQRFQWRPCLTDCAGQSAAGLGRTLSNFPRVTAPSADGRGVKNPQYTNTTHKAKT